MARNPVRRRRVRPGVPHPGGAVPAAPPAGRLRALRDGPRRTRARAVSHEPPRPGVPRVRAAPCRRGDGPRDRGAGAVGLSSPGAAPQAAGGTGARHARQSQPAARRPDDRGAAGHSRHAPPRLPAERRRHRLAGAHQPRADRAGTRTGRAGATARGGPGGSGRLPPGVGGLGNALARHLDQSAGNASECVRLPAPGRSLARGRPPDRDRARAMDPRGGGRLRGGDRPGHGGSMDRRRRARVHPRRPPRQALHRRHQARPSGRDARLLPRLSGVGLDLAPLRPAAGVHAALECALAAGDESARRRR
jgi:hypothetical protein